jgi:autophagy-related protein 9
MCKSPQCIPINWCGESSLATGLLKDVPPELELSDYRKVPPIPGSESP